MEHDEQRRDPSESIHKRIVVHAHAGGLGCSRRFGCLLGFCGHRYVNGCEGLNDAVVRRDWDASLAC